MSCALHNANGCDSIGAPTASHEIPTLRQQISFEPGFGAYQSSAQKIKVRGLINRYFVNGYFENLRDFAAILHSNTYIHCHLKEDFSTRARLKLLKIPKMSKYLFEKYRFPSLPKVSFPGSSPSFCSSEGSRTISKPAPNPGAHQTPVETPSKEETVSMKGTTLEESLRMCGEFGEEISEVAPKLLRRCMYVESPV